MKKFTRPIDPQKYIGLYKRAVDTVSAKGVYESTSYFKTEKEAKKFCGGKK